MRVLYTRNNPKGAEELPLVIFHPDLIQSPLIQQAFGKEVKGSNPDGAPTQSHTCHTKVHHSTTWLTNYSASKQHHPTSLLRAPQRRPCKPTSQSQEAGPR